MSIQQLLYFHKNKMGWSYWMWYKIEEHLVTIKNVHILLSKNNQITKQRDHDLNCLKKSSV